jgi:hypothetical protein
MNRRKSGLQGAALFALVAAAGLWGCSGDDASPGGSDAAGDTSTGGDAGSTSSPDGAAAPDATPDSAFTSDAPSPTDSSPATDSAADASSSDSASTADVAADVTPASDATTDATGVDASDGDASAAPALPQLCTLWDTDFQLNEADASAMDAYYDRTQWWGYSIATNFAQLGFDDCSINAIFSEVSDTGAYVNAIATFAIQLMGCSLPTDAGALGYAITNDPGLAGIVFSTTDVNQLSADFMAGVTQTLSCGGPCPPNDGTLPNDMNFPPMPALSADQIGAINAELYFLGQNAPNTAVGSHYSNSSCPPPSDAGTDASPDGG